MNARAERLTFGHGRLSSVPTRTAAIEVLAHEPEKVRLLRLATWDWGWGGLLLFSILLFFRPQDQIAVVGAMHVSDISAIIGLGAMLLLRLSRGQSLTRVTPELIGVFALGGVILLTVPTSFWPGGSFHVFTDMYIKVALIFMLFVNTATSPRRIERICWVIVLAFGYVSAHAIFDYARGANLVEGNRIAGAAGGFFENPNDLALNLAAFMPLAIMYVKRPGPSLKRMVSAGIVLMMCATIVFTKSRSGMVGTVAMFAVFALISRTVTPATIIGGMFALMVTLPMLPQSFWERMESITDESKDKTHTREARRELMIEAWHTFLEHPITGIGAGQFQNFNGPEKAVKWRVTHNAFLQVAAEIGIFGVVFFFFLIVRGFSAAWWTRQGLAWIYRSPPRGKKRVEIDPEDGLSAEEREFLETHASALVACLAGWLVCAFFASVAFHWTFYYLLALSVCARDVVRARSAAYAEAKKLEREGVVIA
jgi:O-antigen ligase